jgi:hypothetical protein
MQMDQHDSNIEMEKQKADALKKQIGELIEHEIVFIEEEEKKDYFSIFSLLHLFCISFRFSWSLVSDS